MTDAARKKRVSSGISQLDHLLGDLFIGDNVLWYEDAGSFSAAFCVHFIRESLAHKKPIIYVSFDRSPKNVVTFLGPLAESQNFTILDCFTNGKGDRSGVFNKFYEKDGAQWPYQVIKVNDPANPAQVGEAIYGLHGNLSGDIRFIMDSLTGMQDLWGGEEQVTKFYARTCPRLYELDTIAYWIVEKGAHSSRLKANINKIAQVAIDLSVRNGKPALKILKAEKRDSKFLNEPQAFSCEETEIVFDLPRPLPGRFDLGARIKAVRKKQGLSQKELAEKAGVTPSSISQIEKNLIYPSLPALFRLAESLSIGVASFFEGLAAEAKGCVYRGSEGTGAALDKAPKGMVEGVRLLPPDLGETAIETYLLKIEPSCKLFNHFFSHKGEEMGYLLSGSLAVWVNGQRQEAGAGDLIYLRKETPEQWENSGDCVAELLWVKIR
ncbi:transcriptional regulator, XRE family [Desulfobulbus propionicus DSM 2032]|uniref:Transcriptional regulator, XRE family n=1 Tax=Desulfobulbus propionicus (strain ATCC 33891 / DSM 2032 / VKM B-1956 / 1pr3) TaxID=577650 RepID=A0A7U4DPV1_DESPD|nr:helix-turn-helix domain-containing protein [Desulfobulbus propionicus]ADW18442.1 transcriptional regulator, XRE family [Desulfobulbus propionicus DSM 2032]